MFYKPARSLRDPNPICNFSCLKIHLSSKQYLFLNMEDGILWNIKTPIKYSKEFLTENINENPITIFGFSKRNASL